MQTTITEEPYRIDILPFAEAMWAPRAAGTSLRWAWRIIDAVGNAKMVGSSNDPEQKVREFAIAAVTRLKLLNNGKPSRTNVLMRRKPEPNMSAEAATG